MKRLKVPSNWGEISALHLIQLEELELEKDSFIDNEYDYLFEQLAILCGLEPDDDIFYELTGEDVKKILKDLKWFKETHPSCKSNHFEWNGVHYKAINFETMKLAEWITLEGFILSNFKINAHRLLATVYRRTRIDEWGEEIMEPFTFDFEKRANEFLEAPLDKLPIKEFLEFRENCYNYFDLTNKDKEDSDEPIPEDELMEDDKLNYRQKVAQQEKLEKERLQKVFNWEKLMLSLANNNVVDSHKVLELPVLYIFRVLTLLKNTDN